MVIIIFSPKTNKPSTVLAYILFIHCTAVTFCPSNCNLVLTNQIGLVIVQDTNPETFYNSVAVAGQIQNKYHNRTMYE